jgi:hypothetical protein
MIADEGIPGELADKLRDVVLVDEERPDEDDEHEHEHEEDVTIPAPGVSTGSKKKKKKPKKKKLAGSKVGRWTFPHAMSSALLMLYSRPLLDLLSHPR